MRSHIINTKAGNLLPNFKNEKDNQNIFIHNWFNLNPQLSGGCKPSIILKKMTNLVTILNVDYMYSHIKKMVGSFYDVETMFNQIEKAMSHFDYETERIETYVFGFLMQECRIDLEQKQKNYKICGI